MYTEVCSLACLLFVFPVSVYLAVSSVLTCCLTFQKFVRLNFFLWFVKESFLPGVEVAWAVFCLFAYLAVSSVLYRLFDFFFPGVEVARAEEVWSTWP